MHVMGTRNITDAEKALLKTELTTDPQGVGYKDASGNWKSAQEIARLLTYKPLIPNPDPQGTVPAPINKQEFLTLLLPSIANISDNALIRVSDAIDAGDRQTALMWLSIAKARTWIDQTLHDTLAAKLTATVPDPDWPAQVRGQSPIERVLGRATGIAASEVTEIINMP